MLNIANYFYPLKVDECPADHHFVSWLESNRVSGKTIFHFGTGGHHLIGVVNAEKHWSNSVLGITASPQEYQAYMDLAIDRPVVAAKYKVFFGDIYQLDAGQLPGLDVVSLFHLCEFYSEKNAAYGAMNDLELALLLCDKLRPGGHMLFYTGSFAFERAKPVIAEMAKLRSITETGRHETLLVYQKQG